MADLSDFDFKHHLNVFQVILDDVVVAHVPMGALEHFLLCLLHVNRTAKICVNLFMDDEL